MPTADNAANTTGKMEHHMLNPPPPSPIAPAPTPTGLNGSGGRPFYRRPNAARRVTWPLVVAVREIAAKNPKLKQTEIGEIIGRSHSCVSDILMGYYSQDPDNPERANRLSEAEIVARRAAGAPRRIVGQPAPAPVPPAPTAPAHPKADHDAPSATRKVVGKKAPGYVEVPGFISPRPHVIPVGMAGDPMLDRLMEGPAAPRGKFVEGLAVGAATVVMLVIAAGVVVSALLRASGGAVW